MALLSTAAVVAALSLSRTPEPLWPQQVTAWLPDEQLLLQPPTAWAELSGSAGTVCIAGADRIGKSTLLSVWGRTLTGAEDFRFEIGHDRDRSQTQGLWSAVVPREATKLRYHLNLCDTQGLKKIDGPRLQRLFAASVLLPSVLVYVVIDHVQNNEIEDLYRMARLFQAMSEQMTHSYQELLAPHLIVVVRAESGFSNLPETPPGNLSGHLERALQSNGVLEEQKRLVDKIFPSREAWELPGWSREAKRKAQVGHLNNDEDYINASQQVLDLALKAIDGRLREERLPESGRELTLWYRNVLEAINGNRLDDLVTYGEQLQWSHVWKEVLLPWRWPLLTTLVACALLGTFPLLRNTVLYLLRPAWFDWLVYLTWLAACASFVGASPLVTLSLDAVVPRQCAAWLGEGAATMLRPLCQQLTARAGAVFLGVLFAACSFPFVRAQLLCMQEEISVLEWLLRFGLLATLGSAVAKMEVPLPEGVAWPLAVFFLGSDVAMLSVESLRRRWFETNVEHDALMALNMHYYVVHRYPEVAALARSSEWATHYRRRRAGDALWRFRQSARPQASAAAVDVVLLAWAHLVKPYCDSLLLGGVLLRLAEYIVLKFARELADLDELPDQPEVALEEPECEPPYSEGRRASRRRESSPRPVDPSKFAMPESPRSLQRRREIEAMREEQEGRLSDRLRQRLVLGRGAAGKALDAIPKY